MIIKLKVFLRNIIRKISLHFLYEKISLNYIQKKNWKIFN